MCIKFSDDVRFVSSEASAAEKPETEEISFDSILTHSELLNQLNNIGGKLGIPVSLIQFREDSGAPGGYRKLDSELPNTQKRSSCTILHEILGSDKICYECAVRHAEILKGVTDKNIKEQVLGSIEKFNSGNNNDYREDTYNTRIAARPSNPEFHETGSSRVPCYLTYTCPFFGYVKCCFPILYAHKVIGVFIIGQYKITENISAVKEQKSAFFKENAAIIDRYINSIKIRGYEARNSLEIYIKDHSPADGKNYLETKVINSKRGVIVEDSILNNKEVDIDSKDDITFEQFKNISIKERAIKNLEAFMEVLFSKMHEKRKRYTQDFIDEKITEFNASDDWNAEMSPNNNLNTLMETFKKSLKDITDELLLSFVILYGAKSLNPQKTIKNLGCLLNYQNADENNKITINPGTFSLHKLDGSVLDKPRKYRNFNNSNTDNTIELTKALPEIFADPHVINNLNRDKIGLIVLLCPEKKVSNASIALVIGVNKNKQTNHILDALSDRLLNFMSLIGYKALALFANMQEERFKRALAIHKHEIIQLVASIRIPFNKHLVEFDDLKHLNKKKHSDIKIDIESSLDLMGVITNSIEFLLGDADLKKTDVFIFKDLLFKWKIIFSASEVSDASTGQLLKEIVFPHIKESDDLRRSVYSDKRYLSVIVYNLMSNAVKYSYFGTKIHVDCVNLHGCSSRHSLTFDDYGIEMINDNDDYYDIYYRDSANSAAGNGIGLYVVKKACESIGASVSHNSKWVSDYNIPMLEAYIRRAQKELEQPDDYADAVREYNRLKESGELEKALTNTYLKFLERKDIDLEIPWRQVKDQMHNKTYRVTLKVEL